VVLDDDALYTADQVSEHFLPYCPRWIMQLARDDKLKCTRLSPKKIRFKGGQIRAFIDAGAAAAQEQPVRSPKYANR
jgi:hypothetical protein